MISVARRHEGGWALGGALGAVFLGAVDLTVISTVLPAIVADFEVNTANIDRYIWIVNAYLLAYIVAIPIVGRMSDLLGRRVVFLTAMALFLTGAAASALADTLPHLIAARAVQGAGGGAMLPVTMALVGDLFPAGRRASTLGLVGAVDTLGWVLGPLWGALIVEGFGGSWRWIFWINLPLGLAVAAFVQLKPRTGSPPSSDAIAHLDAVGILLLGGSLLAINLGLASGGEAGMTGNSVFRALGGTKNPLAGYLAWFLLGGAVLLTALVSWERRARNPMFPATLLRDPVFVAALAANFLIGAALITAMVDVPLSAALLVSPERVSAASAILLAPFTILMAAMSLAGGVRVDRFGARRVSLTGIALVVLGYAGVWAGLRTTEPGAMIPGLVIAGAGFGLVIAPISASAIDQAHDRDRGLAAASVILVRLMGMTIGLSALTAFGIRRLQSLSARVTPIVRGPDESTADFFVRQNRFIEDVVIPMTLRVVRETFLLAGLIAMLAAVPVLWFKSSKRERSSGSDRIVDRDP